MKAAGPALAWWTPFRALAPGGRAGRLPIFIFHRVMERHDPLRSGEPDAERFERIVRFIVRNFRILPLVDAAQALVRGRLPAAAACITFDDGYADNVTRAAPILQRHGATATVFVSTAYVGGGCMWNDRIIEAVRVLPAGEVDWLPWGLGTATLGDDASRCALIERTLPQLKYRHPADRAAVADEIARHAGADLRSVLMLSIDQLRAWRDAGFDVGGHTMRHPVLARLDHKQAADEIGGGREQLTQWLGEAPRAFAYPNGAPTRDYGARDVVLSRAAGYTCAVTTARGAATPATDPYQLPRFTPWDRSMWAFGFRCAQTLADSWRHAAPATTHPGSQESVS